MGNVLGQSISAMDRDRYSLALLAWPSEKWFRCELCGGMEGVHRLPWGEHCANGTKLDRHGGLSLERIVLDHLPSLFTEPDREQAKRTLGVGD